MRFRSFRQMGAGSIATRLDSPKSQLTDVLARGKALKNFMLIAGAVVVLGLPVAILPGAEAARTSSDPTFHEDVLPILQRRCQTCHRPGEVAPMSLLNYDQVRPWAKAMKAAVLQKRMPPWFADSRHGEFRNDTSLTKQEIDTLVSWADRGAPAGAPDKAPQARAFADDVDGRRRSQEWAGLRSNR